MAIAGDFSAVVKIIQHPELRCQFVLVGRNVGAVHRQRRIAVTHLQIAKHLIVGAVLFDHIDHVLDRILAPGKLDRARIVVQQIIVLHGPREFVELAESRGNVEPRDRTPQQCGNVGVVVVLQFPSSFPHALIRARPLALRSGDDEITALDGERAGIPISRDKSKRRQSCGFTRRSVRLDRGSIKYCYGVGGCIRYE